MKTQRSGFIGAMTLVLAGCVTPPTIEPALSPLRTESLGLQGPPALPAPAAWWKGFGDPQLDALVEEAFKRNPSLAEAMSRVRTAQAQAQAAGAATAPNITLDGEEQRQRLPEHFIYPPKELGADLGGGGIYWLGQLGLNLSWDLDFWGRQASVLAQAQAGTQAAELDRASARLALSGSLAQAYVDLYRAHELADIAADAEKQRAELLRLTRNRVKAGLDTQLEQRTGEGLLPQARGTALQAESARALAVHRLAALAGHGADVYTQVQRPQIDLDAVLPLPDALPADLLSRRPDVLAAIARVHAATAGQAAAKAAFYPDISLRSFVGFQAAGLGRLFDHESAAYGVGPALHLPVFEAQRLKAGYRGASADVDAAIAAYNDAVLNAVREVSDQLTLNDLLSRQIVEARQFRDAADAAHRLAQHRYAAGLTSQLAVLNAETQVLIARRDLLTLNANLVIARVSLLLTLGGSFDPGADAPALADKGSSS